MEEVFEPVFHNLFTVDFEGSKSLTDAVKSIIVISKRVHIKLNNWIGIEKELYTLKTFFNLKVQQHDKEGSVYKEILFKDCFITNKSKLFDYLLDYEISDVFDLDLEIAFAKRKFKFMQ
jgi:hypothetical protein